MRRILLSAAVVLAAVGFVVIAGGASGGGNTAGTYKIELDNAFGLVSGADFKVAGVRAGMLKKIDLDQKTLHAVVTVDVTESGFGQFHSDAFCQSRPQSLIGEYFIDCSPGQSGKVLKPGSTIPVNRTQSTIPADLLADVMRMPYRQRFSLIVNELGAGVAARSTDLQDALHRAVPAIDATDNLLTLLANDSSTLQALTANSDAVITALANNSRNVQRFVHEANNTAIDTATQQAALRSTLAKLPGFLEQLKPALQKLGAASDANTPVLVNLNTAAGQLNRLFTDLPPFSNSALPSLKSLGKASITGKAAVLAATPTIAHLNQFSKPTPELAQNLAIVLRDLDNRSRAVEPDPRSPGGQGYTGLEALLQYAFNQTLAINTFGPFGHQLAVDAFISTMCSPYASQGTVATNLKNFGPRYRSCYAWLGSHQPGINSTDPSNPSGCVPDPGGAPPGKSAAPTTACKLGASPLPISSRAGTTAPSSATPGTTSPAAAQSPTSSLGNALGQIISSVGGRTPASKPATPSAAPAPTTTTTQKPVNQAQQLLNYLLAP